MRRGWRPRPCAPGTCPAVCHLVRPVRPLPSGSREGGSRDRAGGCEEEAVLGHVWMDGAVAPASPVRPPPRAARGFLRRPVPCPRGAWSSWVGCTPGPRRSFDRSPLSAFSGLASCGLQRAVAVGRAKLCSLSSRITGFVLAFFFFKGNFSLHQLFTGLGEYYLRNKIYA